MNPTQEQRPIGRQMKWILFTGTWSLCTQQIAHDVREKAREVLARGDGIVTGGATGVDYEAMMEALAFDPSGSRLQVCLPTNIENYSRDYHHNWIRDYVTPEVVDALISCLYRLQEACPEHVHALPYDAEITQDHYDERHGIEVELADEVYAFHANGSHGTQDTINKAVVAGLPITVHLKYHVELPIKK